MALPPTVVLLEFNELTPALIDQFIAEGELPSFRRFRDQSIVVTTQARERAPDLEPWIQWVTVHTGLDFAEHGLSNLNEGHKLEVPRVWDLLSDAGFPVWVCGSMNVRYQPNLKGYVVPDPWCTKVAPRPEELRPYFDFVQRNVLEYTNDRVPLSKADYARFATFMAGHGASLRTGFKVLQQLISEKGTHNRWKRAALLDRIQFDVFRHYFEKSRPLFSTFFLNSTAHYQHTYWRNMEPDHFVVKPTEEEQAEYGTAVLFGYQQMDQLLAAFLDLAGDDVTLILATALSQQPCVKYEEQGGAHFYRPKDFRLLSAFAGVQSPHEVAPVMTHQFHVEFGSEQEAVDAERRFGAVRVGERQALEVRRTGSQVFVGCRVYSLLADDTQLDAEGRSGRFFDVFYRIDAMKSGMHHDEGLLWVRTPARTHAVVPGKVPLASVAPTLLQLFGVTPPKHMAAAPVESLLAQPVAS